MVVGEQGHPRTHRSSHLQSKAKGLVTLKCTGLGLLVGSPEVWLLLSDSSRTRLQRARSRWRTLHRSKDTEFHKGADGVTGVAAKPFGEATAAEYNMAVTLVEGMLLQRSLFIVPVATARRSAIGLVAKSVRSWHDLGHISPDEIEEWFPDGPTRAMMLIINKQARHAADKQLRKEQAAFSIIHDEQDAVPKLKAKRLHSGRLAHAANGRSYGW